MQDSLFLDHLRRVVDSSRQTHVYNICLCIMTKLRGSAVGFSSHHDGLFLSSYTFSFTAFLDLMMFSIKVKEKRLGRDILYQTIRLQIQSYPISLGCPLVD